MLRSFLEGFGCRLWFGFLLGLRLHLSGELLLDLEGDGVGVHFVRSRGLAEGLGIRGRPAARRQEGEGEGQ